MFKIAVFASLNCIVWMTLYIVYCAGQDMPSLNNCPEYVGEGESVRCICLPSSASHSTSWPGLSTTSTLYVANVDRALDGTQYVCRQAAAQGTAGGEVRYTVRVAYGPDRGRTSITQSPFPFIVDGVSSVVLTCLTASPVSPSALYRWSLNQNVPITCNERRDISRKTCTYVPQTRDVDSKVACTVTNTALGVTDRGELQPRYLHPPPLAPNIIAVIVSKENTTTMDGENQTRKLSPGSVVKCEVRGGRPLVSNIVFTCDSPHHPDMPDVAGPGSVASYVTVTDDGGIVTCICSATWAPKPEVYLLYSNASFEITSGQQQGTAHVTQSPSPFTVDGVSSVMLTCLPASPVYPGTVYLWTRTRNSRIDCDESPNFMRNTCTYKPRVIEVGKAVMCIAVSPDTGTIGRGEIQPRFLLPGGSNATGNVTLIPSTINDKTILIIAVAASGFVALVIAGTLLIVCIRRNRNRSKGNDSCDAEDSKGIDMSLTSNYCNVQSLSLKERNKTSECDTDATNTNVEHGKQDTLPKGRIGNRSKQATLPRTEDSLCASQSPRPLPYVNVSPHPISSKMSHKNRVGATTNPLALDEEVNSETSSDITQDIDDLSVASGEDYCNLVPPFARHDDIRHYSDLLADHGSNEQSVCSQ